MALEAADNTVLGMGYPWDLHQLSSHGRLAH